MVRRSLVAAGINLLALKNTRFRIGEVVLETTGLCHSCSKMETNLGPNRLLVTSTDLFKLKDLRAEV